MYFKIPFILCLIMYHIMKHYAQRKRLGVVGELVFRQPITKVDNCNIADVLFISQIYNVKPELKYNKEQKLRLYSSSPNNAKPYVISRFSSLFVVKQFAQSWKDFWQIIFVPLFTCQLTYFDFYWWH
jgi:hypothetical protein